MGPHTKTSLAVACPAALLLLTILAPGCSQPDDQDRTYSDAEKIAGMAELNDVAGNPEDFKAAFVEGSAPDETQRLRYKGLGFRASDVDVSGDSATMTVTLIDMATGEDKAEMPWTAQKVGDQWKLKDAPLPDDK